MNKNELIAEEKFIKASKIFIKKHGNKLPQRCYLILNKNGGFDFMLDIARHKKLIKKNMVQMDLSGFDRSLNKNGLSKRNANIIVEEIKWIDERISFF